MRTDSAVFTAKIFENRKGAALMVLGFAIGTISALGIPYIFHNSYGSFVFGAIMFFAIPLFGIFYIKDQFIHNATVSYAGNIMTIDAVNNYNREISLEELHHYQISPFQNFVGKGYVLKVTYKTGYTDKTAFLSDKSTLTNISTVEPLIWSIVRFIDTYNSKKNGVDHIELRPSLLASASGKYFVFAAFALIPVDICLKIFALNPQAFYITLYIIIFGALVTWGQRRQSQKFFKSLQDIQGEQKR